MINYDSYALNYSSSKKKEMIISAMSSFNYYSDLLHKLGTIEFVHSFEEKRIEVIESFDLSSAAEHFNNDLKLISHANKQFYESIVN